MLAGSDPVFLKAVFDVRIYIAAIPVFFDLFLWTRYLLLSSGLKNQVTFINVFIGVVFLLAMSIYLVVYLKMGI